MIRLAAVVLLVATQTGCAYLSFGMDYAGQKVVSGVTDICTMPRYRKNAASVLINGRLAQINASITVCCPGDSRTQCRVRND